MATDDTKEKGDGHSEGWVEFTQDMCKSLNNQRCLVLVTPSTATAMNISRLVSNFSARMESADESDADLLEILRAPRVLFTTSENISKVQRCTAVHGRVPMLAVVEMREDRSFVLDLSDRTTEAEVERFLRSVQRGAAPQALQGAPAPLADAFEPSHGIVLRHAFAAVTCSIERLKRARAGGAVCVFWSERCQMCPVMMVLIDKISGLVWEAAKRHGLEEPFSYITCNIDQNELPPADWPTGSSREVVPTIVAYTPEGQRVVYTDNRSAASLAAFVCAQCLPEKTECIADITAEAVASAATLCDDEHLVQLSAAKCNGGPSPMQDGATLPKHPQMESETDTKDEVHKVNTRKRDCGESSEEPVAQKERNK